MILDGHVKPDSKFKIDLKPDNRVVADVNRGVVEVPKDFRCKGVLIMGYGGEMFFF